ncbi:alginate lyase family protein [Rhizobium grahamii]|uniref:Poly(Beta-D-mannuronate) lyase n=2 Tax=Rhizobium grahamii TaxID=1120045 RepID=S3H636_9HYPH|nr:alginate lyase family protein [Rhizobium grahamii]EPE94407.1 poly(beta-D-mannuronate) lyase [Rhizobium grahamii CCGE 502]RDJ06734.1 alginate lyase [Rhizobium grahamii]
MKKVAPTFMAVRHGLAILALFLASGAILPLDTLAAGSQPMDSGYQGLFDVAARKAFLAQKSSSDARTACLAVDADAKWMDIDVIKGLTTTEGYGTDRSGNQYAFAVMVLSGRALAGDKRAEDMLKRFLLKWADAGAFSETEKVHDAYYALKRLMLPTVVAFSIIRDGLSDEDKQKLVAWIDPLVRRTDQIFEGSVDYNNHRYLADSVLMAWGSLTGDRALYQKGIDRFRIILDDARADGSLPLETRRGARALWYMRQSLTSMTVMAEVANGAGDNLFDSTAAADGSKKSMWTVLSYWMNGMTNPILVNAYSAENYIPGPEQDFLKPDFGFLENRGNGRHYLAFLEAIAVREPENFPGRRASALLEREGANERPLIDEFAGGNATCFWRQG